MVNAAGSEARTGQRVALAGIVASMCLAAMNIAVGLMTQSTSVFATGVEFAGDVLASIVVLFGLIAATRPPDDDHPYGHGRIETLAAFVVGLVLSIGGVGICWNALQEVGAQHPPPGVAAIAALAGAIVVRAVMSVIKFRVGRRIRSASLVADAWNDAVDILSAGAALTAVALTIYDSARFMAADHYGGFVVGIVVIGTGLRVLRDASLELMDTMPDQQLMEKLKATVLTIPEVRGVDKAYARKTGMSYHVDLHIEVDPAMSVADAHVIAGRVRHQVRGDLGWVADVLVHVEPAGGDTAA
jgi:cation diffusion facilitator family transporter